MNNVKYLFPVVLFLLVANTGWARDTTAAHAIKDALDNPIAENKLSGVTFYFGKQKHPKPQKTFREIKTNNKTNAFGKSDEAACQIAFLSSLIKLQNAAIKQGGNAVINIHSNYRNIKTVSNTEYQCGAGAIIAGVALKGTVVKIQ